MSKIDDGGPAFPEAVAVGPAGDVYPGMGGMSLRDWFAGQAMVSVVALIGIPEDGPDDLWDASLAKQSYAIADAMLAARSKDRSEP